MGGFEPSGHDGVANALLEEGINRGHDVVQFHWGEKIEELAIHPVFHVHRVGTAMGAPALSALLDDHDLWQALVHDLVNRLDISDYQVIVSVHPWSTLIAAEKLRQQGSRSTLIDYTIDFGRFPIVVDRRIDSYIGAGDVGPFPPRIRQRCQRFGIPVRQQFVAQTDVQKSDNLVVSGGTDGFLSQKLSTVLPQVVEALEPALVTILAPTSSARSLWDKALPTLPKSNYRIEVGKTDISQILKEGKWYLTKASTGIVEGLAAGCELLLVQSGVFWEDDARDALVTRGVAFPVDYTATTMSLRATIQNGSPHRQMIANECITAAAETWNFVEKGCPNQKDEFSDDLAVSNLLSNLVSTESSSKVLPETTKMLKTLLDDWVKPD